MATLQGNIIEHMKLMPPLELFTDFKKDEFDVWVKKVKEKRDGETKEKELAELKRLKEKYPND